jgi:hypothetical protein
MAGASSLLSRQQNLQRGFEFSRLHEEWMAIVYALVVPGRSARPCQQVSGGPRRTGESGSPAVADRAKRRAG